jgi:hypothetical protein
VGNLHLTEDQEEAIVMFLKTLSDGYHPSREKPEGHQAQGHSGMEEHHE